MRDRKEKIVFQCTTIPQHHIIQAKWQGDLHHQQPVQEAALGILKMLKATGYSKVLNDNRLGFGRCPAAMMEWIQKDWIQALTGTHLRAYAHVMSTDLHARKHAYDTFIRTIHQVDFAIFDSYDMAMNWLTEH